MFDIIFFMFFGWALTLTGIGIDEMILKSLEQLFDKELTMVAYYLFFGALGVTSYLYYKLVGIVTRD